MSVTRDDKHFSGDNLETLWAKVKTDFVSTTHNNTSSGSNAISGNKEFTGEVKICQTNSYVGLVLKSGKAASTQYTGFDAFKNNGDYMGSIGVDADLGAFFMDTNFSQLKIWHLGNMGSGSGLDADKLDDHHASYFAVKTDTSNAIDTLSSGIGGLKASLGTMAYRESIEFLEIAKVGETTLAFANGTTAGPTLNINFNGMYPMSVVIPSASASYSGVVTTGTQTFAGAKTFSGGVTLSSTLTASGAATFNGAASFNNDVVFKKSGTYLPIDIKCGSTGTAQYAGMRFFDNSDNYMGTLGVDKNVGAMFVAPGTSDRSTIWHSSNSNLSTVDWAAKDINAAGNVVATGGVAAGGIADLNLY